MLNERSKPETGTFLIKRHTRTFLVSATVIARAPYGGKKMQIQYFDDEGMIHRRTLRSDDELARFTKDEKNIHPSAPLVEQTRESEHHE
jgi:hypothetical protein